MRNDTIHDIVQNKNDMIFSSTDALYLDCGYGAWVGSEPEGLSWCSPYKGETYLTWKRITTYLGYKIHL